MPASPVALPARLRDVLAVWLVPFFPVFFLGWSLSADKTLSVPKLVLPLFVVLSAAGLPRIGLSPLRRPAFGLFGAYLLWVGISVAVSPHASAFQYGREVLIVLYLLGIWARPPLAARRVWANLEVVGLFLAAWTVTLAVTRAPIDSLAYAFVGTPNIAAAFLTLLALRAIRDRRWWSVLVFVVGLLGSQSIGGMLALLVGLFVLESSRTLRIAVLCGLYSAAVLFVGVHRLARDPRGVDGEYRTPGWKDSVAPRAYIAHVSLAAFREGDRLWLGHGLGRFSDAFLAAEQRATKGPLPWWRYGDSGAQPVAISAHNDALRMAVESGLPSALLWLAACLALLWDLRRLPLARSILVALLVQSTTDILYSQSNVTPVFWTALALERAKGDQA